MGSSFDRMIVVIFQLAPGIEFLQLSFPDFVAVEEIPVEGLENQVSGLNHTHSTA